MKQCIVQVTVTGRIPVFLVVIGTVGAREQSLLEDARVTRLIEGGDSELLVGVLLDDAERVLVCVKGCHEDEWDINALGGVKVLDLAHSEIEKSHVVFDFKRALGAGHAWEGVVS
jgi:hypothetical protein